MKNDNNQRRDFLKLGLASLAATMVSSEILASEVKNNNYDEFSRNSLDPSFNMCGYAAPKLKKVRIGFIGLGMRGPSAVERISHIENVEIKFLCDLIPERAEEVRKKLNEQGIKTKVYSGENGWKTMLEKEDFDLVYMTTPWDLHTPMAIYAMKNGKHVALEVPAARTLEECWELVETSEKTKKHCMMLENCCYDFFELMTLNMARQGFFGEIIHGEGAYIHNLVDLLSSKEGYQDMWRLKENALRNGNIYPTHGLGPICQIMNINRGDCMDYLTSVSSGDYNLKAELVKRAETDSFYSDFAKMNYRGNMNTTTIKTKNGRTIMIQHDVSSPRPYSRIHLVSGSKAMARKWPEKKIATGHEGWLNKEEMEALEQKFKPEIVSKVGEMAKKIGGHGGMDFIMDWKLIDSLRNGLPLDQDVYDAALWSSIAPLSEKSIANRSLTVDVPDFTRGAWKTNKPLELSLEGGGNTGVK